MKEKKTKEEKQKNWQDLKGEEYWMDMKAVLK